MDVTTSKKMCENCAECCKHYSFIELSQIEIKALEIFTGLRFDVFTYAKGKAVEEYFLKFKKNGYCYFLNNNNGTYSCSVYEARPSICRNYPSNSSQNKACDANSNACLGKNVE